MNTTFDTSDVTLIDLNTNDAQANDTIVRELAESELLLVGGGNGDVQW